MKRATKKEMLMLKKVIALRKEYIDNAYNLCIQILKKHGNKIVLPSDCISDERTFDVYLKHGHIEEMNFAGAAIVLDELCLYGGTVLETGLTKLETVTTGYFNETELGWIAQYLIRYVNEEITSSEEFEEE